MLVSRAISGEERRDHGVITYSLRKSLSMSHRPDQPFGIVYHVPRVSFTYEQNEAQPMQERHAADRFALTCVPSLFVIVPSPEMTMSVSVLGRLATVKPPGEHSHTPAPSVLPGSKVFILTT